MVAFRLKNGGIMAERNYLWQERKRLWCGLPWTFTKYALTEDRLFVTAGLFKTVENEVRLYRVMDLSLSRGLIQKMFGLGTIRVSSSDKNLGNFELINIKNSEEVKEQISELVEENRDKKRVSSREYMGDNIEDMPDDE